MSREGMDRLRGNLELDAFPHVRVVFGEDYFTGRRDVALECVSCERDFLLRADRGWFECPVCTYELTQDEARRVLLEHIRLLDGLAKRLGFDLAGDLLKEFVRERTAGLLDRARSASRSVWGNKGDGG